ncbi:hypothetical protein J5N58_07055 [Rhizobium cremeum]|uniref:hypothetical protein n=2 Tax=Rhizobium cremeum TaxID=2813827 RepID=UPI001FD4DA8D|nr:hypothetical protein [Rhizobium cremeum]MCJ7996710.1 hypothetical protein [Rhizobium cremeum]MCJ7999434.1 hypothetical protein [Rhizobium cremeum]
MHLVCYRCRMTKHYRVDEALAQEGDVSIRSLPVVIARLLRCPRVDLQGWERCRLEMMPSKPFSDIPKPRSPSEIRLPVGVYRIEDMPLSQVPEHYEVFGYCPCGRRNTLDIPKLARDHPAMTTFALATRLVCRRCRNATGNFLAYRFLPR